MHFARFFFLKSEIYSLVFFDPDILGCIIINMKPIKKQIMTLAESRADMEKYVNDVNKKIEKTISDMINRMNTVKNT